MSWVDSIENIKFTIETGDGMIFWPLWRGGTKEKEFNTSSFEFINVYGTLVDRKKPKSGKFDMVFWFQGEDNIEQADKFEISADDPRPWKVTHPFYGEILGQPISIKRDDSNLNITEITVPFWESIVADYPTSNYSVKDNTRDRHNKVYALAANSYTINNPVSSADISKLKSSINEMSGLMTIIQDSTTYADFQNQLNKGLKAIDSLLDGPLSAMENIQLFLDLPSLYEQALGSRISNFEGIYSNLKSSISTLADKKYFESVSSSLIASMSLAIVNPLTSDLVLVSDISKATSRLRAVYDDYLATLDTLKVSVYDVNKTYNPDPLVQTELSSLVTYVTASLYKMTFGAKRERIVYTTKDTNLILLVHRYLGLDDEDENISTFREMNNIRLNELFLIKKGREIRYAK